MLLWLYNFQANKSKEMHHMGKKYHISLNDDDKWQVKAEKAERALKIFDTQKEAIDYAKVVAENQEGNIVIHKVDGKIRKQAY